MFLNSVPHDDMMHPEVSMLGDPGFHPCARKGSPSTFLQVGNKPIFFDGLLGSGDV